MSMTHNAHDKHLLDADDEVIRAMLEMMDGKEVSSLMIHQALDERYGREQVCSRWYELRRMKMTDTTAKRDKDGTVVRILSRHGKAYLTGLRKRERDE